MHARARTRTHTHTYRQRWTQSHTNILNATHALKNIKSVEIQKKTNHMQIHKDTQTNQTEREREMSRQAGRQAYMNNIHKLRTPTHIHMLKDICISEVRDTNTCTYTTQQRKKMKRAYIIIRMRTQTHMHWQTHTHTDTNGNMGTMCGTETKLVILQLTNKHRK